MHGFLATGATFQADLLLLTELAMGGALLAGMFLARAKRFGAHKVCQSSVVLLNLALIGLLMLPSFRAQVVPGLSGGLRDSYFLVASIHAGLGTIAEFLGIYVILVAATSWIPERFRFQNWRLWMRTTLALWWAVIVLGLGTYYVWYMAPPGQAAPLGEQAVPAQSKQKAERVTVKVSNFEFAPKEATIAPGDTVEWVNEGGRHTVKADGGSFQSPMMIAGDRWERKFEKAGRYPYYCSYHGDKGGKDMAGVVIVEAK